MNNIVAFCGLVLLSIPATPNSLNYLQQPVVPNYGKIAATDPDKCVTCKDSSDLDLGEIVFIEEEAPIDLGFDTADYLPEDFDPYEVYVDLNSIEYLEAEDEALTLDTAAWLPEKFNPYASPADVNSISYMEVEEDFYPAVDTSLWLPEGFDPYAKPSENPAVAFHSRESR